MIRSKRVVSACSMRSSRGNVLILLAATTFIIIAIALLGLGLVRLMGSSQEQHKAIEAAALSAARELSSVVVNTDECGWVSLSDAAPVGTATASGDSFYLPARGINTIIATHRLDMLIAQKLGDPALMAMVKADMKDVLKAQETLRLALVDAIKPGVQSEDINGKKMEIYKNAETAYLSNSQRMSGASSYHAGSLKLSLGCISGNFPTNTSLPGGAPAPTGVSGNTYYAYQNFAVDDEPFVLSAIADGIKLVKTSSFVATAPGVPYFLPTVVMAEADQKVENAIDKNGNSIHASACAVPANVSDPRPAPGALTFSFPDGPVPEVPAPGSMLTYGPLNASTSPATYQTAVGGDFPIDLPSVSMQPMTWPYPSMQQTSGTVFRRALLDWWKRAGTRLNVDSAANMMNPSLTHFSPITPNTVQWRTMILPNLPLISDMGPVPAGLIHIYKVDASGLVSYQRKALSPQYPSIVAQDQLYAETLDAITSSAVGVQNVVPGPSVASIFGTALNFKLLDRFDFYLRDMVRHPGKNKGGAHGGEPMDYPKVAMFKAAPPYTALVTGRELSPFGRFDQGDGALGATVSPPPPSGPGSGFPLITTEQSDLAEKFMTLPLSPYKRVLYNQYRTGSGIRQTYQTYGMAVDVRFRRQVDCGPVLNILLGKSGGKGYIAETRP